MHIKTNIELNIVHLVILAICPIMFIATNSNEALCLALMTIISFFISVFICLLFNKILTKKAKILITALLSSLIVTLLNYALTKYNFMNVESSEKYYFSALSAIVLAVDIYYIDTKAVVGNVFSKILLGIVLFFGFYMIYAMLIEFLSLGSLFGTKIMDYSDKFFASIPFSLIWLGMICAIAESIYKIITQKIYDRQISYEKFVKKVRNEKIFQYDNLRRKKLLINPIEVRKIDIDEAEAIKEKSNANESLEDDSKNDGTFKDVPKKEPRKKNKKLKVSKEAKIEQIFEKQTKEGDE